MAGSPLKKSVKSVNWYNLALLFKKRASKRNSVYTAFPYLTQTFAPRVISTLLRQEDHKSSKRAFGLQQNIKIYKKLLRSCRNFTNMLFPYTSKHSYTMQGMMKQTCP